MLPAASIVIMFPVLRTLLPSNCSLLTEMGQSCSDTQAHLGPGLDLGQLQRLVGEWSSAVFCRLQDAELQAEGAKMDLTA